MAENGKRRQCRLPPQSFRADLRDASSHISIDPLGLYLSPESLFNFLRNLYIPLWLGKIFKFMVLRFLNHLRIKNLNLDIFTHGPEKINCKRFFRIIYFTQFREFVYKILSKIAALLVACHFQIETHLIHTKKIISDSYFPRNLTELLILCNFLLLQDVLQRKIQKQPTGNRVCENVCESLPLVGLQKQLL